MPRGLRLLSAALLTCMVAVPAFGEELKVGDKAPEFEVQDHTGQTRRLSDYRGKNVVLWFYPKASTPG